MLLEGTFKVCKNNSLRDESMTYRFSEDAEILAISLNVAILPGEQIQGLPRLISMNNFWQYRHQPKSNEIRD